MYKYVAEHTPHFMCGTINPCEGNCSDYVMRLAIHVIPRMSWMWSTWVCELLVLCVIWTKAPLVKDDVQHSRVSKFYRYHNWRRECKMQELPEYPWITHGRCILSYLCTHDPIQSFLRCHVSIHRYIGGKQSPRSRPPKSTLWEDTMSSQLCMHNSRYTQLHKHIRIHTLTLRKHLTLTSFKKNVKTTPEKKMFLHSFKSESQISSQKSSIVPDD